MGWDKSGTFQQSLQAIATDYAGGSTGLFLGIFLMFLHAG